MFSAPWARGRTLAWAPVLLLVLAFVALTGRSQGGPWPWAAVLGLSMHLLLPLVVGPWVGVWVRRRGWPPRQEGWALVAALALTVTAVVAFERVAAEPIKQWIAERIGDVDETGQRRRVALHIGVMVKPIGAADGDTPADANGPGRPDDLPNTLVRAAFAFWLGGGLALVGWRRELAALATLERERELREAQAKRREAELRLSVLAGAGRAALPVQHAGRRAQRDRDRPGAIATDPARASAMVDRLVEYLRAAIPRLRSDGGAEATVAGQFDLARAYLGLMAARMPRLSFTIDAPGDLQRAHCPPLLLISLVENAVKHGVEPKVGPARVDVTAHRSDDGRLEITVADDGVGFNGNAAGSGLGLANIRERLAQLYGDRAALALRAPPEGGVAATLTLPLEEA
ncbi:MAG: sensor histidine kinase [Burkholderiaceae bacterium]|nr:sensor histidine kinase [Burkholderiaceae bacterium]